MPTATKLNRTLIDFIEKQHMFFVATAAPDGRVNLSPKGMETLKVLDDTSVVWLNLSGSGNETAAHLLENPRMTLMFCAFEGSARILRVYGDAKTTQPGDAKWEHFGSLFQPMAGSRQIFSLEINLIQTSCGTGVPLMDFRGQRGPEELLPFYEEMGESGVRDYWNRKNATSIDGKPTGIVL